MKFILWFMMLILLSSSAQAYSKKIIFSSFSDKISAQKSLDSFMSNSKKSKTLSKLAEDNEFKVFVRQSGKYHIIVAEPIKNRTILKQTLKIVKSKYKQAYPNNYTPPKVPIAKPKKAQIQELNTSKKLQEVKVSHPVVKEIVLDVNKTKEEESVKVIQETNTTLEAKEINTTIVEENSTVTTPVTEIIVPAKEVELDIEAILKWMLFVLILSVMTFYFIKFKRIYDEY